MKYQNDSFNWQQAANVMTTEHNPYFNFIDLMSEEFDNVPNAKKEPPWVKLVREWKEIRKQFLVEKEKKNKSLLARIERKKEQVIITHSHASVSHSELRIDLYRSFHSFDALPVFIFVVKLSSLAV